MKSKFLAKLDHHSEDRLTRFAVMVILIGCLTRLVIPILIG
jgi:hypothetical protein